MVFESKKTGKETFIPVFAHKHEDKFNSLGEHYHIDFRFVNFVKTKHFFYKTAKEYRKSWADAISLDTDHYWNNTHWLNGLVKKEMPCIDSLRVLNLDKYDFGDDSRYRDFYLEQIGKSCAGKRCPHYGTQMVEKENGLWQCPLHGLVGDPLSQKIILGKFIKKPNVGDNLILSL